MPMAHPHVPVHPHPSVGAHHSYAAKSSNKYNGSFLVIDESKIFASNGVSSNCRGHWGGAPDFEVNFNYLDEEHLPGIVWSSTLEKCKRQRTLAMQYLTRRILRGEPIVVKELVKYIKANQGN
jgi:hypothetical protein